MVAWGRNVSSRKWRQPYPLSRLKTLTRLSSRTIHAYAARSQQFFNASLWQSWFPSANPTIETNTSIFRQDLNDEETIYSANFYGHQTLCVASSSGRVAWQFLPRSRGR